MKEGTDQHNIRPVARRLIVTDLVAIVAMLIVSAWAWTKIPAGKLIPIHWGINGQPDGFADKTVGLLWAPSVAVLVSALILGFLLIPRRDTVVRSAKAYVAVGTTVMALLLGVHVAAVMTAVGATFDMVTVVLTLVGGMFIVVGNYFPKMRRNRWMGIRTPWTRASELVWDRTHRLASRLFIGLGLLLIVVTWSGLGPAGAAIVLLTGTISVTLAVYTYSYIVWIANPDK